MAPKLGCPPKPQKCTPKLAQYQFPDRDGLDEQQLQSSHFPFFGKAFHGDGSQLDGVTVNTSFLVSGRVSNTTILLSSGSFTVEGRSGNIDINA